MTDVKKDKRLNIYQRILEIRKSVDYLQKNSQAHKNKYVPESVFLSAIRPKMDELEVVLEFSMRDTVITGDMATITADFTWLCCDDPTDCTCSSMQLQCKAGDPQLIGGCLTYMQRFYLQKTLQIPIDTDDLDTFTGKMVANRNERLSDIQVENIKSLCAGRKDILNMVVKHAPEGKIENILARKYDGFITSITKQMGAK